MMKNLLYFSLLFLVFSGCSLNKQPVFKKISAIEVLSFSKDTIVLKATVFFENSNHASGKISVERIQVLVNDIAIANVTLEEFKVPARKEFMLPLIVEVPTKKMFNTSRGAVLSGLIGSLLNKTVKVQLKGNLKYKVFGFSSRYAVNQIQEIKF